MAGFRRLRGNVIQPGTLDFEFENFDASKITREEFFIAKKMRLKTANCYVPIFTATYTDW